MHIKTFETINLVTDAYVRELKKLRHALAAQLAMVDAHLTLCVDFSDAAVELPLEPEKPTPEKQAKTLAEDTGYQDPKFVRDWKAEDAAKGSGEVKRPVVPTPHPQAGGDAKFGAGGIVLTNLQPVLTPEDEERLKAAVA